MILALIGLLIGIFIGILTPVQLPTGYADYMAIAILAALDSIFGGLKSGQEGTFDGAVFLTGFFTNTLLAAFLTYAGDKLGVNLLLGATVAFSIRIFNNVGFIRRHLLTEGQRRRRAKATPAPGGPS